MKNLRLVFFISKRQDNDKVPSFFLTLEEFSSSVFRPTGKKLHTGGQLVR